MSYCYHTVPILSLPKEQNKTKKIMNKCTFEKSHWLETYLHLLSLLYYLITGLGETCCVNQIAEIRVYLYIYIYITHNCHGNLMTDGVSKWTGGLSSHRQMHYLYQVLYVHSALSFFFIFKKRSWARYWVL